MNCPYCHNPTKVTNSRSRSNNSQIWRRRRCKNCQSIWTTHEQLDPSTSHKIKSKNNSLQPFSRDKLFLSINDSLNHRKTAIDDATALTDTVLQQVLTLKSAIIQITEILTITHHVLANFDPTAAAVYKAKHN